MIWSETAFFLVQSDFGHFRTAVSDKKRHFGQKGILQHNAVNFIYLFNNCYHKFYKSSKIFSASENKNGHKKMSIFFQGVPKYFQGILIFAFVTILLRKRGEGRKNGCIKNPIILRIM